MQVPLLIAPGLTFGAALSNSTHERPCSSLPVTTRRIGFSSSAIQFSCFAFARGRYHATCGGHGKTRRREHNREAGMRAPGRIGWLVGGALSLVSFAAVPAFAQAENF